MFILIFKNVRKEAAHFYYFLEAYQRSWAILNAIFEGNSSSIISESRNYLGKGKSNVDGQRSSSWKGFESITRHTALVYVLSNIYKVKLITCTMKRKRNEYIELICFQTPLFPHPFLRVQITLFSMLILGLGLDRGSGSYL